MESQKVANPGSNEAYAQGCLCPRIDNCDGQGRRVLEDGTVQWVINNHCSLHGEGPQEDNEVARQDEAW